MDFGEHWHKRADQARSLADEMKDEISKQMMLQIADNYERLANRAKQRAKPSATDQPTRHLHLGVYRSKFSNVRSRGTE